LPMRGIEWRRYRPASCVAISRENLADILLIDGAPMSDQQKQGPAIVPFLEELLVQTADMPWRAKSLAGVHEKMLSRNEETGASVALIRFEKGASIPTPHLHASNQMMYCLKGKYEYTSTGVTLVPGSFYCNPKGSVHGPTLAH